MASTIPVINHTYALVARTTNGNGVIGEQLVLAFRLGFREALLADLAWELVGCGFLFLILLCHIPRFLKGRRKWR